VRAKYHVVFDYPAGHQTIAPFGVVSQSEGVFERMMRRLMTAPIVGSLARSMLTHFRVELEYPNHTLYLQPEPAR
jgi:hypothetical protein